MKSPEETLELFCTKFKLQVATTPELKAEAYKIRYKVYCEDLQYEPADHFPDEMESDRYDQQSIHLLLQHQESKLYAGCVRLIIPQNHSFSLPFEAVCKNQFNTDAVDISNLSRDSMFEVSRLAATSEFRKRKGELKTPDGLAPDYEARNDERRGFPIVPLSLYLGVLGIMCETKLEHLFTMMEPRLARHLRHVGFQFHQIGELVEYHGKRGPFYIHRDGSQGLHPTYKPLQTLIREEIKQFLASYSSDLTTVLRSEQLLNSQMIPAHSRN